MGDQHDDDGYLDEGTRQWIQQEADEHFGGQWGAAAAAILEAAHAAASAPDDPWAGPTSYQGARARQSGPDSQPGR